jgi:hypothetical protein
MERIDDPIFGACYHVDAANRHIGLTAVFGAGPCPMRRVRGTQSGEEEECVLRANSIAAFGSIVAT